jgi:hypothetical protein
MSDFRDKTANTKATGVGSPVLGNINETQWKRDIVTNFKSGNTEVLSKLTHSVTC